MKLNVFLVPVFILIATSSLFSQQLPLYSQYNMNKFLLNPSVAGLEGYTTISLVAHEQWIGFKGAPKTHALTFDSRMLTNSFISRKTSVRRRRRIGSRSSKVGLGAHIYNDRNGPIDKTGIHLAYAYHLDLREYQLSFGLSAQFFQFRLNTSDIVLSDDQFDDLIQGNKLSLWIPDANIGLFFTSREYYIGYSTLQILKSSLQFGEKGDGMYRSQRQHNLIAGYKYMIDQDLVIEPSFLLKFPEQARPQLDVSVRCNVKREYWGGLTFRTGSSLIIYGGIKVNRYYFGYAFDYNFNSLMKYTWGSHEILAAVKFGDTARRYRWLNSY